MELKVPFLADRQLESAATELLRKYAKWKGTPPRPPIPVDDIVEGLLELSLSIGDLRTRLGKNDVLGATWLDDGHVMIDSSLEGNEGRFSFTLAHETGHWVLHRPIRAHAPQLRPFFGYYGGKWRDALKHYPEPDHETIVEPFAGSAGFSLRYAHRKIILCEIDPVLSEVWRYLIRVKAKEILAIPDLDPEGTIDDLKVPQEAKWLVGFWLNRGAASPRKSPSKWMREGIRPGSFWGPRVRQTIASQVDSIRHWQLFNCSYADAPTPRTATWFVDPPYEAAGRHYRFGSEQLDYEALGAWCRSRPGQVIVCENEGATWLPFRELADVKTTRADRRSKEVIWLSTENGHRPSPKRNGT